MLLSSPCLLRRCRHSHPTCLLPKNLSLSRRPQSRRPRVKSLRPQGPEPRRDEGAYEILLSLGREPMAPQCPLRAPSALLFALLAHPVSNGRSPSDPGPSERIDALEVAANPAIRHLLVGRLVPPFHDGGVFASGRRLGWCRLAPPRTRKKADGWRRQAQLHHQWRSHAPGLRALPRIA